MSGEIILFSDYIIYDILAQEHRTEDSGYVIMLPWFIGNHTAAHHCLSALQCCI